MNKDVKSITNARADSFQSMTDLESDLVITVDLSDESFATENGFIELPNPATSEVELLEARVQKNGVEGLECELLIDQDKDQIYEVDVDGTIFLSCEGEGNYEINENGELIYNYVQ